MMGRFCRTMRVELTGHGKSIACDPCMGTALVDVVKLMWDNAGKRMGMRRKLQLANKLKKIQSTAKTQTNEILTPEQVAKWEAMKEAAKEED